MIKQTLYTLLALLFIKQMAYAQTDIIPTNALVTAAYATGGNSSHKEKILWLTWGAQSKNDTYGKHDIGLTNGAKSYARIDLGGGHVLKIAAEIKNIEYLNNNNWRSIPDSSYLKSYAPGNYTGDSMDKFYNIGGTGSNNKLVSGLINGKTGGSVRFKLVAKATLNDMPIKLDGMVLGDAESLNGSGETFYASGHGDWTVIDVRKNTSKGEYIVKKEKLSGSNQPTKFTYVKGNDQNTGAVAFMSFNENAYSSLANGYAIEFDVMLKGTGLTAIALGLVPGAVDMGDAPKSYGDAIHMLEPYAFSDDKIVVNKGTVNINTDNYNPGNFITTEKTFLGTTPPDGDTGTMYSINADGDDLTGPAGPLEEDAWPAEFKRFSHLKYYKKGDVIEASIKYTASKTAYVSGWIDFDQNGKFDSYEKQSVQVAKAKNGTLKLKWTVPNTRILRNTYVRLRVAYNREDVESSTGVSTGGEVEDHKIYILTPVRTNPILPNKSR